MSCREKFQKAVSGAAQPCPAMEEREGRQMLRERTAGTRDGPHRVRSRGGESGTPEGGGGGGEEERGDSNDIMKRKVD